MLKMSFKPMTKRLTYPNYKLCIKGVKLIVCFFIINFGFIIKNILFYAVETIGSDMTLSDFLIKCPFMYF